MATGDPHTAEIMREAVEIANIAPQDRAAEATGVVDGDETEVVEHFFATRGLDWPTAYEGCRRIGEATDTNVASVVTILMIGIVVSELTEARAAAKRFTGFPDG